MIRFCHLVVFSLTFLLVFNTFAYADEQSPNTIGVRQLTHNAAQYTSIIQVEGVVEEIYPEYHLLTLIDLEDAKIDCCSEFVIPVKLEGKLPKTKDHVLVEGVISTINGIKVFDAKSFKWRKVDIATSRLPIRSSMPTNTENAQKASN